VIGVLAPDFVYTDPTSTPPEMLTPLVPTPPARYSPNHREFPLVRLRPGVGFPAARAEAQAIIDTLRRQYPDMKPGQPLQLVPVREHLSGPYRPVLLALLGATGCVLLIACTNLASLVLARGLARAPEIAVLLTLGFPPRSVLASFVAESALIAAAGGVIGGLMALPINGIVTSTTNWASFSEIAFAFRVSPALLLAGLIFAVAMGVVGGFFPAWRAARLPVVQAMR